LRSKWTRSSPSVADPLDPGAAGFAHRGLHHGPGIPENSLVAFAAALEFGAGIECDLRLTADGQIVVFHDADAWRLCASPMRIGRSTLADLGRLQLGGRPIPTLASLFALVAGRVPLLLEVKVERDIWRWIPALRRELAGYAGRFGMMSFDPRVARLLKTNVPEVRRGLILRASTPPLRRRLFLGLADPHFLAVELPALHQPWVSRARGSRPLYAWTVRTPAQRAQSKVQADALIWEADGRP
jgi:glycerophosphoryl diester phosphodiesterase